MLIDFTPIFQQKQSFAEFTNQFTNAKLVEAVNAYVDFTLQLIRGLTDMELTFVPADPDANDPYAAKEEERHVGWNLAHQIAHVTASVEESAAFSAILARGIAIGGRLRSERDWRQLTSCDQVVQRLEECRRICLGYLAAWPDTPDLTTTRILPEPGKWPAPNATASFLVGLMHWSRHIPQFQDTITQARAKIASYEMARMSSVLPPMGGFGRWINLR